MKRIVVLMSTFNGEKYLASQIDSILNQKGDFKINMLIRDDGSSDLTCAILKKYEQQYENIRIIWGENVGWMKSFDILIREAEAADYYAFSDQDDIWFPEKISKALDRVSKLNVSIPVAYGSNVIETDLFLREIPQTNKKVDMKLNGINIMLNGFCLGCTMLFNAAARNLYLKEPKEMYYVGHDWLLATLCAFWGKLIFDDNAYMYHRRHGDNVSGTLKLKDIFVSKIKSLKNGKVGYTCYREIYSGYKSQLSSEDYRIVSSLMTYKHSYKAKLFLLCNPKVRKYTLKGTMLLKIAILFNKYI